MRFLPIVPSMTLPAKLYHGTSSAHLGKILNQGLLPRAHTGESGWAHTLESRADAVYLTSAYPLHYAANVAKDGAQLLLLEIDTSKLDVELFMADEDGLAQTRAQLDKLPRYWTLEDITEHYRKHAHEYPAEASLSVLGVCAYRGSIPAAAVSRMALLSASTAAQLILSGIDPTVSAGHYRYLGAQFEASVAWLFGDLEKWDFNPFLSRPDVTVLTPQQAKVAGLSF